MKIIGIGIVAFLLFQLQRWIYRRLWDKNLKVSVSFAQKSIREGENGEIIEVIENRKRLPLPLLKVKFQTARNLQFEKTVGSKTTDQYYRSDVFQIGSGEKITRTLTFTGEKRGYYHIRNIDLIGLDLFLTDENLKSMTTDCYLYVYPKEFGSDSFRQSLQKLNGEMLVKRHLLEDPFEYRGIREYQAFDDIRSVNWKATAKTGALKVNQKNYTAMETIRIFLNIEDSGVRKKDKEVETAIQIVMGLTTHFLSQGRKVSCYTNGRDILSGETVMVAGGAGWGQRDAISKALARIDTSKTPFPFCRLWEEPILEQSEHLLTLFVSPNSYPDFTELLTRCSEKGIDYTWFYPCEAFDKPKLVPLLARNVQLVHLPS